MIIRRLVNGSGRRYILCSSTCCLVASTASWHKKVNPTTSCESTFSPLDCLAQMGRKCLTFELRWLLLNELQAWKWDPMPFHPDYQSSLETDAMLDPAMTVWCLQRGLAGWAEDYEFFWNERNALVVNLMALVPAQFLIYTCIYSFPSHLKDRRCHRGVLMHYQRTV